MNYLSVLKLSRLINFFFQLFDYLLLLILKSFLPQFLLLFCLFLLFLNSLFFSQLLQLSLFPFFLNNFCLQNLLKLLKLLFFSLAIMRNLLNDIFLPENTLVVLSFIDHNGKEANSKDSFDFLNFIRKVFLQSQMFVFEHWVISFWTLVPKNQKFSVFNVDKFDIFFLVIFHLHNQNNFVSSLLEEISYLSRLSRLNLLFGFAVVVTHCEFFCDWLITTIFLYFLFLFHRFRFGFCLFYYVLVINLLN